MKRGPLLLLCLVGGCGGPSPAPSPPSPPKASPARPDAQSPLIVVDQDHVTLDGVSVGDARAMDAAGRFARVDALFSRLKERRDAWRRDHPGSPAPSEHWLDARGAGSVSAMNTLTSAAFAGYTKVHLRTESGWVDGEYDIPKPPTDETIRGRISVQLAADAVGLGWQSERACESVPEYQRIPRSQLASAVDATCSKLGEPCFDDAHIVFESRLPFSEVVATLATIRHHGSDTFTFDFRRTDDNPLLGKSPERVCGKPLPRIIRLGDIPPEEIQKVVRANAPKVRACYELGLARNPKLAGKIVVKMVINEEGRVAEASIVESSEHEGTMLRDPQVTKCVLEKMRLLVFPKPKNGGNANVIYPFVFSKQE